MALRGVRPCFRFSEVGDSGSMASDADLLTEFQPKPTTKRSTLPPQKIHGSSAWPLKTENRV